MKKNFISNGLFIPSKYLKDNNIKTTDKLIIAFIIYMDKYFPEEILTTQCIAYNTDLKESAVTTGLKRLTANGYVEINKQYYKNKDICLGKKIVILK